MNKMRVKEVMEIQESPKPLLQEVLLHVFRINSMLVYQHIEQKKLHQLILKDGY